MNVLILGSGGREHALAWRISHDPQVRRVHVLPGNPGMGETPKVSLNATFENVHPDLVVVGPEKYLLDGTVDELESKGIPVFGPNKAAAFLEGSKRQAKEFMAERSVPTAKFFNVQTEEEANAVIHREKGWNGYVLKLSGPALGKGVLVCESKEEALDGIQQFFKHKPAGFEDGLVIEQRLKGPEVSMFFACTGSAYRFIASACDHKRLKDNDEGPNTGGMGAYSPGEMIDDAFIRKIEKDFVEPTLKGMKKRGTPFSGMLFLGLMIDSGKPYLLEYNVRFGDPETQTFLPLLEGNFAELLLAVAKKDENALKEVELKNSGRAAVHVVKAARGYPGLFGETVENNQKIVMTMEPASPDLIWFFSGVGRERESLITKGGRVCGITALSDAVSSAANLAYSKIGQVSFSGEHFRRDIGRKK